MSNRYSRSLAGGLLLLGLSITNLSAATGKGVQAVLLEHWRAESVTNLAEVLVDAPGIPAVEVAPFERLHDSKLENLDKLLKLVAPKHGLIVIVHLGFHDEEVGRVFEASFTGRLATVKQFISHQLTSTYGSNLTFMVAPMLEDEWSGDKATKYLREIAEVFDQSAIVLVRSSTPGHEDDDRLDGSITNSRGIRFTLKREYHGHVDRAKKGGLYSNDGNIVFCGHIGRSITHETKTFHTVEDAKSYDNALPDDSTKYELRTFKGDMERNSALSLLWRPSYNGRDVLLKIDEENGHWRPRYDVHHPRQGHFVGFDAFEAKVLRFYLNP